MNALRVEIDRLSVTLDGFANAGDAEAMAGIERELRRAIDRALWPGEDGPPDAAMLRAAIVERLVEEIREAADDGNPTGAS